MKIPNTVILDILSAVFLTLKRTLGAGLAITAVWLAVSVPSADVAAARVPQGGQTSIAASGGLEVLQLRPNFYMIAGGGSNVGVQIGDDGVVVVDAGSSASAKDLLGAIQKKIFVWKTGFWGAHNDGWHYELLFIAMCLVIATVGPGRFALWNWMPLH